MLRALKFLTISTAAILLNACKEAAKDQFQQACENGGGIYDSVKADCTYSDGTVIRSRD
jgi:hypothetical protein